MFRSYKYINSSRIEITDSDFVAVAILAGDPLGCVSVAIAKEYARRNLPLAKNMTLFCLYIESFGHNMESILRFQNKYGYKYIDNWSGIAAERDRILDKLSTMK